MNVDEKTKKILKGSKFSKDHVALVIWSLEIGSRASFSQSNDIELRGNLIVKRVENTLHDEAVEFNLETTTLTLATAKKQKRHMLEL